MSAGVSTCRRHLPPAFSLTSNSTVPYSSIVWICMVRTTQPTSRGIVLIDNQVWAGGTALCHIIITCSIFHYLWQVKKTSNARRTSTLVTRLIKLTIETGSLCAAVNVLSLFLFICSRTTLLYVVPLALTSKLYSNCLLAVSSTLRYCYKFETNALS